MGTFAVYTRAALGDEDRVGEGAPDIHAQEHWA